MTNIHVNSFVKRQTFDSEFSHFEGTWDELANLVKENFSAHVPGYRPGVILVPVPTLGFFTPIVKLMSGDTMDAELTYKSRREGETPRKSFTVFNGGPLTTGKVAAASVMVVLYASSVLVEDGDNELNAGDGNWEIISVNASPLPAGVEVPIQPETLMHNHFGSEGGTNTQMSSDEFVTALEKSFKFWNDYAQISY